jgi:hypothetical protein
MTLEAARLRNVSVSPPDPPEGIPVMFNPTEYSVTRGVSYAEIAVPGLQMPLLQFVRGEAQTLSVELFLDRTDTGESVLEDLEQIRRFVTIDEELHAPPVCEFQWGDVTFQGVITSLQERYALFDENGRVLRARLTVSFKSYTPAEIQSRLLNRQSPDRTKTHVVKQGERLDLIAAAHYGDPRLWPTIAGHNGIQRPRLLTPGQVLVIPAL